MRQQIQLAKEALEQEFKDEPIPTLNSCLNPCSHENLTIHFSFDFAQQVGYAHKQYHIKNTKLFPP